MPIRSSPLLGYNNNVRHRGKVFHIQTEDSGVRYGHIMTHLFADGGRILKSVKTSYAEYIGNERMSEIVREMMKQQHKAMFISLRDGKFDVAGDVVLPPPSQVGPGLADLQVLSAVEAGSPTPGPAASVVPIPSSTLEARPAEELALDVDALERAAAIGDALPAQRSSSDLPPPPAKRLLEKAASPAPITPTPPPSRRLPGDVAPPGERRYAPTRPASIFGQARPQSGKSIFGEDLLGDKSLDEVILSYLGDDLDGDDEK